MGGVCNEILVRSGRGQEGGRGRSREREERGRGREEKERGRGREEKERGRGRGRRGMRGGKEDRWERKEGEAHNVLQK